MFEGFTEDTVQFFLDLKFHNYTDWFHQEHERYLEAVQKPFYSLIGELSPLMNSIDPLMELRPYKCLSHIHRDTRFSKDKSPYRDHLWFLFRRAGEPRDKSLFFYFEFGPGRLDWGMGFWGENREVFDIFRRTIVARPAEIAGVTDPFMQNRRHLILKGTLHKRMPVPATVPERLKRWYLIREFYVDKEQVPYELAFKSQLVHELERDFAVLSPLYHMFRTMKDETDSQ